MKPGDSGWVHATVDQVFKDETFFVDAGGFYCESDLLPDHPALPKLAAWLQAHPDAEKRLRSLTLITSGAWEYRNREDQQADHAVLMSLVRALTPDAPETEEAR
jgi:hypothetical protein